MLGKRACNSAKSQWKLIRTAYDTVIGRSIVFVVAFCAVISLFVNYMLYLNAHWLDGVDVYSVAVAGEHGEELTTSINAVLRKRRSFVPEQPRMLKLNVRWVYQPYNPTLVQKILLESPDDHRFFVSFTADQIDHRPATVESFTDYAGDQVASTLRQSLSR